MPGAESGSPLLLLGCASGIIGALALYGYQQERIMALPYGEGDAAELFSDTVFLVLNNRIVAMLAGLIMVFVKRESFQGGPAKWKYFIIAVSNIAATFCQYEALKYVSFPTQTLGKAMKMVPVMVVSRVLSGRTYKWVEWVIAVVVTAGIVLFLVTGDISSKRSKKGKGGGEDSIYGLVLMILYLGFDAFTPVLQEKIFTEGKASRNVAMFFTNASSAVMSIVYLGSTGTLQRAVGFSTRHPQLLFDATLLSLSTTFSQFCIYATVANFGALALAAIMNVRQLVQVLLSMVAYRHIPTAGQVAGLVLVFGALFYQAELKRQKQKEKDKKEKSK